MKLSKRWLWILMSRKHQPWACQAWAFRRQAVAAIQSLCSELLSSSSTFLQLHKRSWWVELCMMCMMVKHCTFICH